MEAMDRSMNLPKQASDSLSTVRLPVISSFGTEGILTGSEHRSRPNQPLLWFVHGFQSERSGSKAKALLEKAMHLGWSFASFDFRGHGGSSPTHSVAPLGRLCHTSLMEDMDVIASHLDSWHTGRRVLVGSSMGGYASAWYAALHPLRVHGLALAAPAWRFGNTLQERLEQSRPGSTKEWQTKRWIAYPGITGDTLVSWQMVEEAKAHPHTLLARRIGCPVLILHAIDDDVIPCAESVEMLGLLSIDAQLLLTRIGGHRLLEHVETLAQLAAQLAEF